VIDCASGRKTHDPPPVVARSLRVAERLFHPDERRRTVRIPARPSGGSYSLCSPFSSRKRPTDLTRILTSPMWLDTATWSETARVIVPRAQRARHVASTPHTKATLKSRRRLARAYDRGLRRAVNDFAAAA
jgi:hypothetical protein